MFSSQVIALSGMAQEDSAEAETYVAKSTADVTVPIDQLKIILRPLMKDELEAEANAWLEILKAKIGEVGEVRLQIENLAENESDKALKEQLVGLIKEETVIADHASTVLDALKAKGGNVESQEQFINAVSDISETTDATSYRAAVIAEVTNWFWRRDGGKLWGRRLLVALFILFFFSLVSRIAGRVTAKALSRHAKTSNLLENFARRTAGGVVSVIGLLMALSVLGLEIGPMLAALGAGGFIVGFALQETLGSFASGLMIMVYRPFDVNDYINVAGVEGSVQEMSLVSTTLLTADNKVLVIPNKKAWGDTIINYTGSDVRRVDLVFGIGYDDDVQRATDVLSEVARNHPLVLEQPEINVQIDELADSSVNLFCRPWVKTSDYWQVRWDLTRQIKERFDADGISFPFPQRDVHIEHVGAANQ